VPVPAVEPVVASWRARFDSSAADGMPAHVTLLYPFLREERLSDGVRRQLRELCESVPVLDVEFRETRRFSDVLYLAPEPADGLRDLTTAIWKAWPEAPPYGGEFDEVIPHLTIAQGLPETGFAEIEADVRRGLPVRARLAAASLFVFDGNRWQREASMPFRGHH
jgi:2'-5' RNA ligase